LDPPEQSIPIDIVGESNKNWTTGLPPKLISRQNRTQVPMSFLEKVRAISLSTKTSLLMEEHEIADIILSQPTDIEVASDGGFNPSLGISSFGWVVAMNKTLVAMGHGPAAAHPDLAESFRAEGYGLAAVSLFLTVLANHFKIDKQKHTWKFHITNKAMIQRMRSYQWKEKTSKWNLQPDADITNFADKHLQSFPATLIHVKSHQDEHQDKKELVSFEAQLNVIADAQATQQPNLMDSPLTVVQGLQTVLTIGEIPITQDSQKWLLQKAGEIPILQYYKDKHRWDHNTFYYIDCITKTASRNFLEFSRKKPFFLDFSRIMPIFWIFPPPSEFRFFQKDRFYLFSEKITLMLHKILLYLDDLL
jgi:hypothetical protein